MLNITSISGCNHDGTWENYDVDTCSTTWCQGVSSGYTACSGPLEACEKYCEGPSPLGIITECRCKYSTTAYVVGTILFILPFVGCWFCCCRKKPQQLVVQAQTPVYIQPQLNPVQQGYPVQQQVPQVQYYPQQQFVQPVAQGVAYNPNTQVPPQGSAGNTATTSVASV